MAVPDRRQFVPRSRAQKATIAFAERVTDEEPAPEEAIADEAPLPLEQVAERELERALARAVSELPEIYRAVVTLRYTEEMSYEEITDVLKLVHQHGAHAPVPRESAAEKVACRLGACRPNDCLSRTVDVNDVETNTSALSPAQREGALPLLTRRDEIITLLARSDPVSAERLSDLYVSYRKGVGIK